jgi:hypothetical protein
VSAAGDARRVYEAALRSGWDAYRRVTVTRVGERVINENSAAIEAARAGNVTRLVDCLRGHKLLTEEDRIAFVAFVETKVPWRWPRWRWLADALCNQTDEDFDELADLVEKTGRRPGRPRNEPVHAATRLAEVLMSVGLCREVAVERACEIVSEEAGEPVSSEKVCDLLDHPKNRRLGS